MNNSSAKLLNGYAAIIIMIIIIRNKWIKQK